MISRVDGVVESVVAERPGAQEISVRVGDRVRPAINYPAIAGEVSAGDTVLLNTWAVSLGLGTGGFDFVVIRRGVSTESEPPGHVLKLRYTPLQMPVLAAESPESPYHQALAEFLSLGGTPVVCAELHSQLPAIAAATKWETQGAARVVYVMTDGAALPIAHSRTVADLKARGLLDATVTCGQAFGGDLEAVNIYSGLAAASAAAGAHVIIVAQGPGGVGTATPLGFSGIDQGIALNAAGALGGTAIAVPRLSFAEERSRHRGISHHTITVLGRIVSERALVPMPRLPSEQFRAWRRSLDCTDLLDRHEFVTIDADAALDAASATGIELSTMGRGLAEERPFFLAATAAGLLAGQWVEGKLDSAQLVEDME